MGRDLVIIIANGVIAALGVSTITFAVLWLRARERLLRSEVKTAREQGNRLAAGDDRVERLQQSVEAMAVEVERVGEAVRFTTRLLSDRAGRADAVERPREPERVITPH